MRISRPDREPACATGNLTIFFLKKDTFLIYFTVEFSNVACFTCKIYLNITYNYDYVYSILLDKYFID